MAEEPQMSISSKGERIKYFLTGGGKTLDDFIGFFTEQAKYKFANAPLLTGKPAIREFAANARKRVKFVTHDIHELWEIGDVVICELDINYHRHDDSVVTLPGTDIFRMDGDLIRDLRVYVDVSPLRQ
ncbi:nuclear transport factor 2 family protein [Thalassoporum mexicanum]|uniref:nuclear transport factor 2 family protein n=2 Tax=Thalassoporum mexicanum TaxID=3457544 RepID=UPI000685872F|nr:nuclear transport factor 2 family protein [Pseudanabaena sp. PCC 7367]